MSKIFTPQVFEATMLIVADKFSETEQNVINNFSLVLADTVKEKQMHESKRCR